MSAISRYIVLFAEILIVWLLPSGCKSQAVVDTSNYPPETTLTATDSEKVVQDAVMLDTVPPLANGYQWVSYRGKADIMDTGGTRTCNYYIVNRVDSIIYVNISAYSIEVMRAAFTPDSIVYVNKLNNTYYRGTYGPLRMLAHIPIDFNLIQDVVQGHGDERLAHTRYNCEYHDFATIDSTKSFFNQLILKDLDHLVEINARIKVLRFNVPGPTTVRVPEGFRGIADSR